MDEPKDIHYWASKAYDYSEALHERNQEIARLREALHGEWRRADQLASENAMLRQMVQRAGEQGVAPDAMIPPLTNWQTFGSAWKEKRAALLLSLFPKRGALLERVA